MNAKTRLWLLIFDLCTGPSEPQSEQDTCRKENGTRNGVSPHGLRLAFSHYKSEELQFSRITGRFAPRNARTRFRGKPAATVPLTPIPDAERQKLTPRGNSREELIRYLTQPAGQSRRGRRSQAAGGLMEGSPSGRAAASASTTGTANWGMGGTEVEPELSGPPGAVTPSAARRCRRRRSTAGKPPEPPAAPGGADGRFPDPATPRRRRGPRA